MKRTRSIARWTAIIVAAVSLSTPMLVRASVLGDILLGGGVAIVVSKFGPQINKAVNKLTGNKDANAGLVTKVVPILSAGSGTYMRAAQVAGPKSDIKRVKAVAQLEGRFDRFRIKALIPVDTMNPTVHPSRVRNVGVTAEIDVKL